MTINRLRRTQPIPSASLVTASAVASQAHNERWAGANEAYHQIHQTPPTARKSDAQELTALMAHVPLQALAARTKSPGPQRVNFSSFSAFFAGTVSRELHPLLRHSRRPPMPYGKAPLSFPHRRPYSSGDALRG